MGIVLLTGTFSPSYLKVTLQIIFPYYMSSHVIVQLFSESSDLILDVELSDMVKWRTG